MRADVTINMLKTCKPLAVMAVLALLLCLAGARPSPNGASPSPPHLGLEAGVSPTSESLQAGLLQARHRQHACAAQESRVIVLRSLSMSFVPFIMMSVKQLMRLEVSEDAVLKMLSHECSEQHV